jgi:hypothetical protein
MKLTDILSQPAGTSHVWLFTRESDSLSTPKAALRRIHSYRQQAKYADVQLDCTSVVVVNCRDHQSEVAIIINIQ